MQPGVGSANSFAGGEATLSSPAAEGVPASLRSSSTSLLRMATTRRRRARGCRVDSGGEAAVCAQSESRCARSDGQFGRSSVDPLSTTMTGIEGMGLGGHVVEEASEEVARHSSSGSPRHTSSSENRFLTRNHRL